MRPTSNVKPLLLLCLVASVVNTHSANEVVGVSASEAYNLRHRICEQHAGCILANSGLDCYHKVQACVDSLPVQECIYLETLHSGTGIHPSMDMQFGDLNRSVAVQKNVQDTNACIKRCEDVDGCEMWTYSGQRKECYLKQVGGDGLDPVLTVNPLLTSGILQSLTACERRYGSVSNETLRQGNIDSCYKAFHTDTTWKNKNLALVEYDMDCWSEGTTMDDWDFHLTEISGIYSAPDCGSQCRMNSECAAYVYVEAQHSCNLKIAVPPWAVKNASGAVLGFPYCATTCGTVILAHMQRTGKDLVASISFAQTMYGVCGGCSLRQPIPAPTPARPPAPPSSAPTYCHPGVSLGPVSTCYDATQATVEILDKWQKNESAWSHGFKLHHLVG
mmetsp:Transcript_22836/g.36446  ORF Transcript_22836/g.36446 Transcript_22836/m.36446 type:complete len:389 (+) Transcript_22836:42-1208(+)